MILLTGATGFIGSHVLKALSEKNLKVRCLSRKPMHSEELNISYVTGDVLDYDSLLRATKDINTVYYFIHMMGQQKERERFDILDRLAINNMVKACKVNGVKRIIHLTGITKPQEKLSRHLASRKEVEGIIVNSGINYTIFRASVIMGKGGAAYEILDAVVRKLPIIPVFKWGRIQAQPIYIEDVVRYLVDCLDKNETINRCFDIACSQVFTYKELMQEYAKELGFKRIFIPVPCSWNWLSSLILGKLAPVNPNVIYYLIESLQNTMTCEGSDIKKIFGFEPLSFKETVMKIREN